MSRLNRCFCGQNQILAVITKFSHKNYISTTEGYFFLTFHKELLCTYSYRNTEFLISLNISIPVNKTSELLTPHLLLLVDLSIKFCAISADLEIKCLQLLDQRLQPPHSFLTIFNVSMPPTARKILALKFNSLLLKIKTSTFMDMSRS